MNVTFLTRARVVTGTPLKLIEQLKEHSHQLFSSGLAEVFFYISANDPQELLVVSSYWHFEETLGQVQKDHLIKFFQRTEFKAELLAQHSFQLVWDYRLVNSSPSASCVKLFYFPPSYSPSQIEEIIKSFRQVAKATSGLLGSWIGVGIEEGYKNCVLCRVDWNSLTAQLEFVGSQVLKDSRNKYQSAGIKIEYASFVLQSMVCRGED